MQTIDGRPVYAATDLVAYLACEHLTQLERAALAGLVERPIRTDPELDVIRQRGFEHEKRYLAALEADGRSVVTIEPDASIDDYGERPNTAGIYSSDNGFLFGEHRLTSKLLGYEESTRVPFRMAVPGIGPV